MSFCSDCKLELCSLASEKPCCAQSELSGLYMTIGHLNLLGRGKVSVQFSSENLSVCRRAYTLLSKDMRLAPQVQYVSSKRFGGTRRCVLTLGPLVSPAFLRAMGMMDRDESGAWSLRATTPRLPITRACCTRAFLRGVMLGGGTMSSPETGYHLELSCQGEEMRQTLAKCLQRLALPIKYSARGDKAFFYYKQSEQIITLLTAIGAHQTILRIEELRLRKQLLGKINRAMNCDAFNLGKQMDASGEQLDAIRRLRDARELDELPQSLKEVALAREKWPDATLEQLGAAMKPPVSKSAVNHRMRRLVARAEELKQKADASRKEEP